MIWYTYMHIYMQGCKHICEHTKSDTIPLAIQGFSMFSHVKNKNCSTAS